MKKIPQDKNINKLGGLSLLPFLAFLFLYIGAGLWFMSQGQEMAFSQFPAPSSALFAFGLALLLGYKDVKAHIKNFTSGIGDETVILMCIIFLLAGAFSAITEATGSVSAIVNMGIYFLPDRLLLPGLFLISCLISFSMGTSMGTISTVIPIAIGLSQTADLNISLVAASVLGGAMFGDNLSLISDTTIAATGTQGCSMKDKMAANLKIALPAALIVLILLALIKEPTGLVTTSEFSLLRMLPYAMVLILALFGVHVVVVLMLGILASAIVGLITSSFVFFDLGQIIYKGFESISDVFFVTILISGLAAISASEGGLDYLLNKIIKLAKGKRSAEMVIATSVSAADICVANNTIAILFVGPMVKGIAQRFNINPARSASIIDTFSCVWQGLIPHGAQMLLVGGLCNISSFAILPYSFYPVALALMASLSIIFQGRSTHDA